MPQLCQSPLATRDEVWFERHNLHRCQVLALSWFVSSSLTGILWSHADFGHSRLLKWQINSDCGHGNKIFFSLGQLLSLLRLIKAFDTMKLERRIGLYKHRRRRGPGWSYPCGRENTALLYSLWFPSSSSSLNWNFSPRSFCKPWAEGVTGILRHSERSLRVRAEPTEEAIGLRPSALN